MKGKKSAEEKPGAKEQKPGQNELAELRETLQRVQAEFENSRKRLDKEKEEFARYASAGLVKDFLPLLDSIDAAEKQLESQGKGDEIRGVELIKKQLLAVLKSHGLEEIKGVGERFNPMLHDCVMQGRDEGKEDGIVLEELQKGYSLKGRILRHAKVKVNRL